MEKLFLNTKFEGKIEIFLVFCTFEKNLKINNNKKFWRKKIFLKNPKNLKKMWKIHIFDFCTFSKNFNKILKITFLHRKIFFWKIQKFCKKSAKRPFLGFFALFLKISKNHPKKALFDPQKYHFFEKI